MSDRPDRRLLRRRGQGQPGPGRLGRRDRHADGHVTELGGGAAHTTNNKMELTGAIEALDHLATSPGPVAIYTDSTYVIKGISEWIWAWRRRGWKTAEGGDVLNRELWEQLARARRRARQGRDRLALRPRPRRAFPATSASTRSPTRSRGRATSRSTRPARRLRAARFSICPTTRPCRSDRAQLAARSKSSSRRALLPQRRRRHSRCATRRGPTANGASRAAPARGSRRRRARPTRSRSCANGASSPRARPPLPDTPLAGRSGIDVAGSSAKQDYLRGEVHNMHMRLAGRLLMFLTVAAGVIGAAAGTAGAQTTETVTVRGQTQSLRLYGDRGRVPVIVSSGDGGWMHLAPHVAESSRPGAFSSSDSTSGVSRELHLRQNHAAGRGRARRLQGHRRTSRRGSEPEAHADRSIRRRRAVGAGGDRSREKARNRRRHRPRPARHQRARMALEGLADLPDARLAERTDIQRRRHRRPRGADSARRDPLDPGRIRPGLRDSAGDGARASEPQQLWMVPAPNHRFSDNLAEFDQRLLEAISWIAHPATR